MLTVTLSVIFEAQMTKNVAVNGASENAGYLAAGCLLGCARVLDSRTYVRVLWLPRQANDTVTGSG